jgi:hypothetical protein
MELGGFDPPTSRVRSGALVECPGDRQQAKCREPTERLGNVGVGRGKSGSRDCALKERDGVSHVRGEDSRHPSYESEDVPALLDELEDTPRSQAQTPGDERRGPLLDGWGGHQR